MDQRLRCSCSTTRCAASTPGAAETVNDQIRAACDRGVAVLLLADTLEDALEMAT